MNKYRVILVQTKSLVITIDAEYIGNAVYKAREETKLNRAFDKRIGNVLAADVVEIERDTS